MNPLRFEHFTPDGTAVAIPLKGTPALEIWPLESNGESRPVKVSLLHQASPTYQSDESNKKVRKTNHSTSLPIRECTASVWLTKSLPTRTLCLGLSDGTVCFWRVPDNPLSNATGGGDVQSFLTYVSLEYTHHEEETIQSLVALRANPAKIGVRVVLALTSRALYAVCLKYIDGEATAYAVCKHLFTTLEASDEAQVVRVQGEDMLVATNTHVALYKLDLMEGGSHIDVASCSPAAVTLVRTFLAGHTRCPSAMAFLESRDRAAVRFVTADAIQPTISVWSGTRSRALAALTCTACAVDLVVQGSLVLTCHGTPTVWIWWDDGSRARPSSAGEGRNRGILHLVYRVTATDHWNIPTAFFSSYPTTLLFISNETSVANSTKLRGKPALLCAVAAIPADLPDPATWNLPGEELPVRDLEITFGWTESSHPSSRTDRLGLPKEPRQVTHGDAGIPLSLAHHARVTDDPEVVLARSEAQRRSDTGSSTVHSQSDHLGVTMRMSTLRTMLQYITSCDFTALRDLMYATSSKKDIESILEILPAPYGVELLRIFVEDLSMEPMVPNCTSPVQSMQTLLLWIRCLLQAHGRHFVLLPYVQPYLSSIRVVLTEHTRHRSVLQNLHTRLVLFGEMCSSAEVETLVTEGGLSDARAAAVQHFSVEDHGIVKRSI